MYLFQTPCLAGSQGITRGFASKSRHPYKPLGRLSWDHSEPARLKAGSLLGLFPVLPKSETSLYDHLEDFDIVMGPARGVCVFDGALSGWFKVEPPKEVEPPKSGFLKESRVKPPWHPGPSDLTPAKQSPKVRRRGLGTHARARARRHAGTQARERTVDKQSMMFPMAFVSLLRSVVWGHHMYTVGLKSDTI